MAKKKRRAVKRYTKPQSIISDDFIIPNHSGDHSAGITKTPIEDNQIANKSYVDTTNKKESYYKSRFKIAQVTFVIDDGYETDNTVMLPMFKEQGEVACSAIVTDKIGTSGRLTWEQIKTLQEAGWEILSHTVSHPSLSGETESEIRTELTNSKKILENEGLIINNLAYPFGDANDLVRKVAREIYRSGRGVVSGLNPENNTIKTFKLFSEVADDDTLLATYKTYVDNAETDEKWLIFRMHNTNSDDATTISSLIDYIQTKGIPIVTINQGLNQMGNYIDAGDNFKVHENGTYIKNLEIDEGATGSFTTVDGKTVTVTSGIITAIV